jgi:F420-non-reducing hydrogenase iron-sulfur subunit
MNEPVRINLFCCLSNFTPEELELSGSGNNCELKVIPLPCSGKLDILYLTKAFETGADGIAVVMCKQGECRYLEGNLRAKKRVEAVDELLEEIGIGKGRAIVIQMDESGVKKVSRELNDFKSKIMTMARKVPNEIR